MAVEVLQRIANLYVIELEGKQLTIEARQQLRAENSLPVLDALHGWLIQTRMQIANGGAPAKALDYTIKRWTSLVHYVYTGHLPIDNNPVENAIRPSHRQEKLDVYRLQTCRTACPQPFKPYLAPLSSTISILPYGSKTRSPNSPPGLIAALMSCCR